MLRSVQSRVRVAGRVYHDKDPSEEAEQANVVFLNEGAPVWWSVSDGRLGPARKDNLK